MKSAWPVVFVGCAVLLGAAACGEVADSAADGGAEVDGGAVSCTSEEDCQEPPSACLAAGTCDEETSTCVFPDRDCTELDGLCTTGACDPNTGECTAVPAAEGSGCGEREVGGCGPCEFGEDVCAEEGTQTCTCTDFVCEGGTCTEVESSCTQSCTRDTEGESCGDLEVSECGSCGGFGGTCDETGVKDCTCTVFTCAGGACVSASTSCQQDCLRDTDGDSCGSETVSDCSSCSFDSACDQTGTRECTCTTFTCANGSCDSSTQSCTKGCSRNTEGDVCGLEVCNPSTFTTCPTCCSGGSCGTTCCGPCE